MTDDRSTDWADDRLARAFADRAASRPTPTDLADAAVTRVRIRADRERPGSRWRTLAPLAATAAVVAVLVGAVAIGEPAMTSRPSGDPATPGRSSAEPVPAGARGLPVLSVGEALDVRDRGEDREIAVRGWFSPARADILCPVGGPPVNPIRLDCPLHTQWLLDSPEPSDVPDGRLAAGRNGFQAVLPFLDTTSLRAAADAETLPEVVFIGHFNDRRGHPNLCSTGDPADCDGFVVDAVHSVNGARVPASPVIDLVAGRGQAVRRWTEDDIDARLRGTVPSLDILSRVAINGDRVREIEPALGTGALAVINWPIVWVVTTLDASTDPPHRRTFILVDDRDVAFEDSAEATVQFVPFTLAAVPGASPGPTTSPTAQTLLDAPSEVLGVPVISVSDALARVSADPEQLDDTELAVRGYYLPAYQPTTCDEHPIDMAPVRMVCPEAFEWLMEDPERVQEPGSNARRRPSGPALNPQIGSEVPFDIPNRWFDAGLEPLPVVVVGHFSDRRASSFEQVKAFVVDALVWRAGEDASLGPVADAEAGDTADEVRALVDAELGPAEASWSAVVPGAELSSIDPGVLGSGASELYASPATWIVRRLVSQEGRPVVRSAYVADGSGRVWTDEVGGCCQLLTTTTIDLGDSATVELVDIPDQVTAARLGELAGAASWATLDGPPETGPVMLGVIDGRPNELRIAWISSTCEQAWQLNWGAFNEVWLRPSLPLAGCRPDDVRREIVLTLDHAVDLEATYVVDGSGGGAGG